MKKSGLFLMVVLIIFFLSSTVMAQQYDMGGKTLRLVGHNLGAHFSDAEGEAHVEEIEEQFNVELEIVDAHWDQGEVQDDMESSVLAGEGDSIYLVDLNQAYQYAAEGFFHRLDHLDYEEGVMDQFAGITDLQEYQGEKYFFNYSSLEVYRASRGDYAEINAPAIAWNKTQFEEQGLDNLYELYEAGEWTWDKFLEIAIEATKDIDGDGETDQWGFSGYARWEGDRERALKWILTNEADAIREEDGRLKLVLDEPEAIEAMEFLQEKVDEGVVAPMEWEAGYEHLISGKSLMINYRPWTLSNLAENMEDDFGIVPFPKGPNADKHISPLPPMHIWVWAIPATTNFEPESLMNLIQELYRDSKDYVTEEDLIEAFREGASMYVRDQESLENKIYAAKNLRIPKYISAEVMEEDIFNMDHEFMQDLLSLERSPENLVDEYKDVIQAALDEM